ncbi:hypothetical protein [Pedobacter rhodius]|uniref:Uncharacterized protein n=1 Tax=Pedobacter rhodius TaxID=3004098 RepID=A0ABT4L509_9SPHI|nr:hypothetical protein [Pedobacter sp. SJ11]MCZ4225512.1 hypothetical protein [Pedobacter sp. SJ11]
MERYKNKQAVKGQDFAKPEEENKKTPSHGEVANQTGGDFSDLEESRMDNPPEKRDANGSDKSDTDAYTGNVNQEKGIR